MKRSQMIHKITRFVHEATDGNYTMSDSESDKLLKLLVTEGKMLPPEALFKGTKTGCLCTMRESCKSCGGYVNDWEDE